MSGPRASCVLLAGWVAACSAQHSSPSDPSPAQPGPAAVATRNGVPASDTLCGALGEACCSSPLPACAPQLSCSASSTCVRSDPGGASAQLCREDSDCRSGYRCCPGGWLGTCQPLDAAACALPDLAIVSNQSAAEANVRDLASDACEADFRCGAAAGIRRFLELPADLVNVGTADLVFGDMDTNRELQVAACNHLPYVANIARRELLDASGAAVASSRVGLICNTQQPDARYDCEFMGIQPGLPKDYLLTPWSCAGLDITDVAAGNYTLKISANPDQQFAESDYSNNSVSVRVQLPAFDDPLQPCSARSLTFSGYSPESGECGWQKAWEQPRSCTPGRMLRLQCDDCVGAPAVRLCEGAGTCSALTQLHALDRSLDCPLLDFPCPESGSYTALVTGFNRSWGSDFVDIDAFECNLTESEPSSAEAGSQ